MTVAKVICDECGRAKAEANHWHKMGVVEVKGKLTLVLGNLEPADLTKVIDLCGESCFHRHVAKLLDFNPPTEAA